MTSYGLQYEIRKSKRARQLRITVYGDGRVLVTQPRRVSQSLVTSFVERKYQWILKAVRRATAFSRIPVFTAGNYELDKERAREAITLRVEHYNQVYRQHISKISIKNQKARWGSCSRKGALNFNYRLLYLPPALLDYVVVHELCHLIEFNHSKKFWALVARSIPDPHRVRASLRSLGRIS